MQMRSEFWRHTSVFTVISCKSWAQVNWCELFVANLWHKNSYHTHISSLCSVTKLKFSFLVPAGDQVNVFREAEATFKLRLGAIRLLRHRPLQGLLQGGNHAYQTKKLSNFSLSRARKSRASAVKSWWRKRTESCEADIYCWGLW